MIWLKNNKSLYKDERWSNEKVKKTKGKVKRWSRKW